MKDEDNENNFMDEDYYTDESFDIHNEIDNLEDYEYFQDTINIIFKEFSYIIDRRSLPLGEHITIRKLEKYMEKYI